MPRSLNARKGSVKLSGATCAPWYAAAGEIMMPFHRQLANARPRTVSQTAAARAVGVSRGSMSKWERGLADIPTSKLVALWDHYGTTAEARAAMLSAAVAE
jgi:predicted XRE-type DNA-binding protein